MLNMSDHQNEDVQRSMQKNQSMKTRKYKSGVGHKPVKCPDDDANVPKQMFIIYILRAQQTVVIIGAYHSVNCIQNFIQHSAVTVNSICRGNYCGSSMWIST
jgi:hypothetical protein